MLYLLIFGAVGLFLYLLSPFASEIIVALVLAVATSKINIYLYYKSTKIKYNFLRKLMISFLLTLVTIIFIFAPFIYLTSYLVELASHFNKDEFVLVVEGIYRFIISIFKEFTFLSNILDSVKERVDSVSIGKKVALQVIDFGLNFLKKLGEIGFDIALILIFYFFFNLYGRLIFFYFYRVVHLRSKYKKRLYNGFSNTVMTTFFASLFNMLAQGVAFFLLLFFIGGYDAVVFGLLAGFLSIIPVVGNALVFIPLVIYELMFLNLFNAFFILIYSIVVMGFLIDNVLRAMFIGYLSKIFNLEFRLNEILLIFSIASGVVLFGVWGVIYGPALLALSLSVFSILRDKKL